MAKRKTFYGVGVLIGLSLALTALLSLTAPAPNISMAQSPTLTPTISETLVGLNQLVVDETCLVPCWLGWSIGEDTLKETQQKSRRNLGKPLWSVQDGNYTLLGLNFEDQNPLWLKAWVDEADNKIVAGSLYVEFPQESYVDWSFYSLSNVLTSYGEPDEVTFGTPFPHDGGLLNIRYYSKNLYLSYYITDPTINDEQPGLRICNDVAYIALLRVWVQSEPIEETPVITSEFWYSLYERDPLEYDLGDVTDLSVRTFTDLLSNEPACISLLPAAAWPE